MASYADIAASGPKQSPEEARAAPVPSLEHSDSETDYTSSLVDVDSPHVTSVPSNFEEQEVQTDTQASRMDREAEAEDKAREVSKKAEAEAESLKKKASSKGKEAKAALKKDGQKLNENKDNPVFVGNALLWGIGIAAIGYGAYQKNAQGKLDWTFAGTVVGIVGAVGIADYFGSKWLLENKYPAK